MPSTFWNIHPLNSRSTEFYTRSQTQSSVHSRRSINVDNDGDTAKNQNPKRGVSQIPPVLFPGPLLLFLASLSPTFWDPVPGSLSLIPQDDFALRMGPPFSGILQHADRISINRFGCYVTPLSTLPLEQLRQPFLSTYYAPASSHTLPPIFTRTH